MSLRYFTRVSARDIVHSCVQAQQMPEGGQRPATRPVSRNQAAVNPFALSDKENFPSVEEVFAENGAKQRSNDGSEPVSLDGGRSFKNIPLSKLFSQSQMQQMKAAERSLKACNHEWWKGRVMFTNDVSLVSNNLCSTFVCMIRCTE